MTQHLGFMATDQYGNTVHLDTMDPKKELNTMFPGKVNNTYVDTADGKTRHVGYTVGDLWFNVYRVHEFKEAI